MGGMSPASWVGLLLAHDLPMWVQLRTQSTLGECACLVMSFVSSAQKVSRCISDPSWMQVFNFQALATAAYKGSLGPTLLTGPIVSQPAHTPEATHLLLLVLPAPGWIDVYTPLPACCPLLFCQKASFFLETVCVCV